jgi:ornithine cyclodeaminase/alanine dehydrogenase-like protein (mu-crystallin family)
VSELPGALKGAHLGKQALEVVVLSEREVREVLDLRDLLGALTEGFRALSAGEVEAPDRNEIAMPAESFLLSMPGVRPGGHMTVKVVTVFEDLSRDSSGEVPMFESADGGWVVERWERHLPSMLRGARLRAAVAQPRCARRSSED